MENTTKSKSHQKPQFPKIIDVRETIETICHLNSNSLCSSSRNAKSNENVIEEGNVHKRQTEAKIENDEKRNEWNATSTSSYNPSQVFISWMNDGVKKRPSPSSRKIRLSYSGTDIDKEDEQINKIRPVDSQRKSNIVNQSAIEIPDNDPTLTSPSPLSQYQALSLDEHVIATSASSIANYLSRSFSRLSSSRRKYRHRNDSLDIPLMEMAGDRGDVEIVDNGRRNKRTTFGPNLV